MAEGERSDPAVGSESSDLQARQGHSGKACADDARAKVKATAIILIMFSSCLPCNVVLVHKRIIRRTGNEIELA